MKKGTRVQCLIIAVVSLAVALTLTMFAEAAEFSADMVQKAAGQTWGGKVFVKGTKMRMEMNTPAGASITITLPDEGKTLMLQPANKMYMEMTMETPTENAAMMEKELEKIATRKLSGTETVSGYECDKYEIVYHDTSMGTMTQWFSKKLKFPVKMIYHGANGEVITEYKNIKESNVPEVMFQVPTGYQKMNLPGM
ncbi:MAG: DUF4412 domain-containing protein [Deltaproteobacteria bacterium]|nr:DUF4412 domain-containing protein [Deltaproteobacteria bacterium]